MTEATKLKREIEELERRIKKYEESLATQKKHAKFYLSMANKMKELSKSLEESCYKFRFTSMNVSLRVKESMHYAKLENARKESHDYWRDHVVQNRASKETQKMLMGLKGKLKEAKAKYAKMTKKAKRVNKKR